MVAANHRLGGQFTLNFDFFVEFKEEEKNDISLTWCEETFFRKAAKEQRIPKIMTFNTLFEIFIFCPKIQLWFPEKIVDFFGWKTRENVVVLDSLALDNNF